MSYTGFLCDQPRDWVGSVWKKYSYRIYKLCLKKCGLKDEADDLFQEVALRFCQKANELNNGVHLLPWFQTVLLNCHYSGYRKRGWGREIPLSILYDCKNRYMGYENLDRTLHDEDVSVCAVIGEISCLISVLNPLEKMIVELSIVGYTTDELSDLIGLSRTGIVRHRARAFQKMQEKMVKQKELLKMVFGRDATLREIIEYAG